MSKKQVERFAKHNVRWFREDSTHEKLAESEEAPPHASMQRIDKRYYFVVYGHAGHRVAGFASSRKAAREWVRIYREQLDEAAIMGEASPIIGRKKP